MVRRNKTKALVIAGVVLFTLEAGYVLRIGSRERQSRFYQQQLPSVPLGSRPSPTSMQYNLPDILQVTNSTNASTQVQKTVSNPVVVQRLYQAILALPPAPTGVQLCPFDTGAEFYLSFYYKNDHILQATVHPGGCRFVSVTGSYSRSTNSSFWSVLANTIGIPESSLTSL